MGKYLEVGIDQTLGAGEITGSGTANYVAKFSASTVITNSLFYDNGVSVGLGTASPSASAFLDITSTSQGFLSPRMTTVQRDAIVSPATGLWIYNTSTSFFNYWDGATWIQVDTSTGGDVSGSGTTNTLPLWTDGPNSVLGNSIISQNAGATYATVSGGIVLGASTTTVPSLHINAGTAPTSPVNGDYYYASTTTGLTSYINNTAIMHTSWTNGTSTLGVYLDASTVSTSMGSYTNSNFGFFTNFGSVIGAFTTNSRFSLGKPNFTSYALPVALFEIRPQSSSNSNSVFIIRNTLDTGNLHQVTDLGNTILTPQLSTSGAVTSFSFTNPANTGQTASTEISSFRYNGGSRQWATGAITTQRETYFSTTTYTAVGASTITDAYGAYFEAPTASTNITITNNWALGTTGNIYAGGKIELGATTVASPTNGDIYYTGATSTGFNFYSNDGTFTGDAFRISSAAVTLGTYFNSTSAFIYTFTNSNLQFGTNNGSAAQTISTSGAFTFAPYATSSGNTRSFQFTSPSRTNNTASTESTQFNITSGSIQFATGALITQRHVRILNPTYSFVASSTITDAYTFYVDAPTAGTNATITNAWAAGFAGNVSISTTLFTPKIIGGTGTTSTLTLQTTTGVGTTGADMIFLVGNNGATQAMRIFNTANMTFGNTSTQSGGEIWTFRSDQNGETYPMVVNATSGTAALASFYVATAANSTNALGIKSFSSGFSTSGVNVANSQQIQSTGSAGLYIGSNTTGSINFYTSSTVRATMTASSWTYTPSVTNAGAIINFVHNISADTAQTASTNIPKFKIVGATNQWATGTLATQYFTYLSANTVAFVGASTATDVYNFFSEAPTAGTNATITNSWAIGTSGYVLVNADTATIKLQSKVGATSNAAIYFNQSAPSSTNYGIVGFSSGIIMNGTSSVTVRISDNDRISISNGNVTFTPASLDGNSFLFTIPVASGLTASTERIGFQISGGSKTWASGAITTQRNTYLSTPTYGFASASTITNAYGLYVEAPTVGANATITNNYAIGTTGDVYMGVGAVTNGIKFTGLVGTTSLAAIYFDTSSPSSTNYVLTGSGSTNSLNGTTVNIRISGTDAFKSTAVGGATSVFSFIPPNVSFNASTDAQVFKVNGGNVNWATGAITTSRINYFLTSTLTANGASTISSAYGLYVEAPTASTNITITQNYAAGFAVGNDLTLIGQVASGTAGIWMRASSPTTTNYFLAGDGSTNFLNAPTTLSFRIGASVYMALTANTLTFTSTNVLFAAATTARPSMNIASGTAPTSPSEGDLWNDSTQKSITKYIDGIKQYDTNTLFTQTQTVTVANTVTETAITGTGVGTLTLPANFFVAGKTLKIFMLGYHSSTGNPTITIRVKLGSTTIMTMTGTSGNGSTDTFQVEGEIACRTTGVTGTVQGQSGYEELHSGGLTIGSKTTATTTIDTTASQAFSITAQWGTADTGNTISATNFTLEVCS